MSRKTGLVLGASKAPETGMKGLSVGVEETAASGHAAWWRRVEFRKLARLLGIDYDAPLE